LYEALKTAEEVDGKIQLRDDHHFPVEAHDTLIVRKANRHIFRLFVALILEGKTLGDESFRRMVVAGPEGIGKVRCLYHELLLLLFFFLSFFDSLFNSCLELVLNVFFGNVAQT
jgi:hypothetical protein